MYNPEVIKGKQMISHSSLSPDSNKFRNSLQNMHYILESYCPFLTDETLRRADKTHFQIIYGARLSAVLDQNCLSTKETHFIHNSENEN